MPVTVDVPNLGEVEFPDEMSSDDIEKSLRSQFGPMDTTQEADMSKATPEPQTRQPMGPMGPLNPEEVLALPQIVKAPAAALEQTGLGQSLEDVAADFLRRTGINPAAQAGEPLAPKREDTTYIPSPLEEAFPEVGAGLEQAARGFTTPGQFAALPFAGLKPVQTAFGAQMTAAIPESVQSLMESRGTTELVKSLADLGINLAGAKLLPRALKSLERVTEEKPDASSIQEATTVHGNLQPQQVQGEGQVPTTEGGGGVQPQATTGVPEAQVGVTPEVPLEKSPPSADTGEAPQQAPSAGKAMVGEAATSPTEPASPEPSPLTPGHQVGEHTGNVPILVSANRNGSTIRLEFDASRGPISAEEIEKMLSGPDRSVSVTAFLPNEFSTAQGRANFRVDIGTPEGPYSTDLAKKVYMEAFGSDSPITGKSAVESKGTFSERFKRSIKSSMEREGASSPNDPTATPPVTQVPVEASLPVSKGIGASVRTKWATATDPNFGSEAGFVNLDPIRELVDRATPYVKGAFDFVRDLTKEEGSLKKLGDYDESVLRWSGDLQRSFDEAGQAQHEIESKIKDPVRRDAITNWIQAGGDDAILRSRADATVDPKLKKGYEAALTLTPEEKTVANDVKNAYDALGTRGSAYDVLDNFKENYVTQIWDLKKGPTFGGARNLRDKFRFNKASTFPTFFDGEQAEYTPKTKDISKLLPVYLHEMNFVIANRQLAERLSLGMASDGRPLAVKLGTKPVPDDYKSLTKQPALAGWKFHPEVYNKLSNILGKSAIREWYSTRTSAAAQIPKAIVKGLDMANSETKRTMLGLISPFHQVQEGTHAVGHRVNPTFNVPKIDLVRDAAQRDATNHGLMLRPDRASAEQFMEGFRTSGLVSKIPGIGPLADHYSNYLFHDYIPGLKYKTYQAILDRNSKVYAKELSSGEVSMADIKHLSAEQANAAYGHLSYVDLARNPTIQHIMQLGLLAPDFLEARARFAGQSIKGITGAKVGREQLVALATLAIAQAATAYTSAKLTGGEWDAKRPFEFHVGNRRYTMRSVPEDISGLIHDPRVFAFSRISPLIGKGLAQYVTGVDYRGQKISAAQTTKELLQQPIPISIRGFLGLGRQSLSGWEQLASAVGLRISRYSPSTDVFDMAKSWMKNNPDPKIQKRLEVQQSSAFPVSEYKPLRDSLNDQNYSAARDAYTELLKTKTASQVLSALSHPHPFTGSLSTEKQFVKSLDPDQKKTYDEAVDERKKILNRFKMMKSK